MEYKDLMNFIGVPDSEYFLALDIENEDKYVLHSKDDLSCTQTIIQWAIWGTSGKDSKIELWTFTWPPRKLLKSLKMVLLCKNLLGKLSIVSYPTPRRSNSYSKHPIILIAKFVQRCWKEYRKWQIESIVKMSLFSDISMFSGMITRASQSKFSHIFLFLKKVKRIPSKLMGLTSRTSLMRCWRLSKTM